jgi:hypothetical protein
MGDRYRNLYVAWTNRRFERDSLLARGEYHLHGIVLAIGALD